LKDSIVLPLFFVAMLWIVKIAESILSLNLKIYGIFPLHTEGLYGIIFSPFIHGSYEHLIANSIPIFVLTFFLLYFYRNLAYRIFFLIYFLSGLCVWLGAREAWHIGASGIVYGLASFLFFSGIIRKDATLLTIAIIVVFLYGSMFWGIFPIKPEISWESHLWGALSGLLLAYFYRHQGPKRPVPAWQNEMEDNEDNEDEEWMQPDEPDDQVENKTN
jgi:membrane associated rhomboid family serine protease